MSKSIDNAQLHEFMDFAAWVNRCLFPVDLAEDLYELGVEKPHAVFLKIEFKNMNKENRFNFVQLWQNFCVNVKDDEDDSKAAFKKWTDKRWAEWVDMKERTKNVKVNGKDNIVMCKTLMTSQIARMAAGIDMYNCVVKYNGKVLDKNSNIEVVDNMEFTVEDK